VATATWNETEVNQKLDAAEASVLFNHPFFAYILLRLPRVLDPSCGTAWTDGRVIAFDPAFVMKLSHPELCGVLCHEVGHVAALHHLRMEERKPRPWNIACDAEINAWVLNEEGLALPKGCVPPMTEDKAAEDVYVEPPPGQGGGSGGQDDDPGGCGGVRPMLNPDGSQMSEAQQQQAQEEARQMVTQAMNHAKAAGKLPAALERQLGPLLEPKVPWREILNRFMDAHVKTDYSYAKPNRRYSESEIVRPSLHSRHIGEVILANDTSGSIDQDTLREIASEMLGALELYAERGTPPTLQVLWCDTKVYPQEIEDAEDLRPQGGGGTAFSPVFEWVKEHALQPAALVYTTDGYCSDFGPAPEYPVLWILTQRNASFAPPFGEIAYTLHE